MSSSSDSEDENIKKFAAAVDVSLFDNSFYRADKSNEEQQQGPQPKEEQKSLRYLESEENVFQSEINVSDHMKGFIGKKMSKIIEESIEFVDIQVPKKPNKRQKQKDRTRLLHDYDEHIKMDHEIQEILPQVKIPIKRRKVPGEEEVMSNNEGIKVKQAAIEVHQIRDESASKNKHKVIEFKRGKDGTCHRIEEKNEYSNARAKNCWNESKIKNARNFGMSLNKVL